ncbi:MAG: LysR family transcriptional regulator [Acetobacteraceae bacterium]|nr:LysR family transcriptional regulator [Acetobacteraceae bacterium]
MDRLDELAVLVAVLDTGSLISASRRLRRSPPAVTRALGALEARIGARLIERTTRHVAPTEAGRLVAEHARRVLAEVDEAMRAGAGHAAESSGLLRVSAPVVFGRLHVGPAVSRFLEAHPRVRAEVVFSDRYLDLVEEGLDAAVRIGTLPDSGLVMRLLGHVRRVVVASPVYLARRGVPDSPDALADQDIIYTVGRPAAPAWRFGPDEHGRVVRLTPRLTVNQVDAALSAARAGQGVARALSYQVAEDLEAGRLVRILANFEPPRLPVQIVMPSGRLTPQRVRRFVDLVVEGLGALPVLRE